MEDKILLTELQKHLIKKMAEPLLQIPYLPGERGGGFLSKIPEHKKNIEYQGAKSYFEPVIKSKPLSPEFKNTVENYLKAAERFSSHIISKGRHYSVRGRLEDGKIFIEEENIESTSAKDGEYILFDSQKLNL